MEEPEDSPILDVDQLIINTNQKHIFVHSIPLNQMCGLCTTKENTPHTLIPSTLTYHIETKKKPIEVLTRLIPIITKTIEPSLQCDEEEGHYSEEDQIEVMEEKGTSRATLMKGLHKVLNTQKSQHTTISTLSERTKVTDLSPKSKKRSKPDEDKDDTDYEPNNKNEEEKDGLKLKDILQLEGDEQSAEASDADDSIEGNAEDKYEDNIRENDEENKKTNENKEDDIVMSIEQEDNIEEEIEESEPNISEAKNEETQNLKTLPQILEPSSLVPEKESITEEDAELFTQRKPKLKKLISENIKKWYTQKLKENHPSIKDLQNNKMLRKILVTEAELGSDDEENDHIIKAINKKDEDENEEGLDAEDDAIINNEEMDDFDHFEKYMTEALQQDNSELAKIILREFKNRGRTNLLEGANEDFRAKLIEEAKENTDAKNLLNNIDNKEDLHIELDQEELSDDAKEVNIEIKKHFEMRNAIESLKRRNVNREPIQYVPNEKKIRPANQSQFAMSRKIASNSSLCPLKERRDTSSLSEECEKSQKTYSQWAAK